ncbi:MAG TPA: hypothetical protein DCE23_09915, partial [Firmicutes bacterium]|nr:hypothetical protein [Bacillota bacterium]
NREKTYNWFKSFSNSTYSCNVVMDVTKLVMYTKEKKESFFINLLYIVVNAFNSIDEMRMRLVDDKPVLYEDINPAFTVMTQTGDFENVRFKNCKEYRKFYEEAHKRIEKAKREEILDKEDYNPKNCYDEYYITCLPWIEFTQLTHPIPDDKSSQCIPRICWGKYYEDNGKYKMILNITVSHIFVDGYPLSKTFIKIQEMLDNVDKYLK